MIRRSLVLSFSAIATQAKGQLGNTESPILGRFSRYRSKTFAASDINGLVNGNGGQGMLINTSKLNATSSLRRGRVTAELSSTFANPAPVTGLTSLAYHVRQLDFSLAHHQPFTSLASHPKSRGSDHIDSALIPEWMKKSDAKPIFDRTLPDMLEKRTPNRQLTRAQVMTLRAQQRCLRQELAARMPVLLEHAFAYGSATQSPATTKTTNTSTTRRQQTYIAGSHLANIATFFNLFRLTRTAFSMDGEIIFTPSGGMNYLSFKAIDAATEEAEGNGKVFSDVKFQRVIGFGGRTKEKKEGGKEAIKTLEASASASLQLESAAASSSDVSAETDHGSTELAASKKNDAEVAEVLERSDDVDVNEARRKELLAGTLQCTTTIYDAVAEAGDDFAPSSLNDQNKETSLSPTGGVLSVQNSVLHRIDLSCDMEKLIGIALNAVEAELTAIRKEEIGILSALKHDEMAGKSKDDDDDDNDVSAAASVRRLNRLRALREDSLLTIADSIFMCGRGMGGSLGKLLDDLETVITRSSTASSSSSSSSTATGDEEKGGEMEGQEESSASKAMSNSNNNGNNSGGSNGGSASLVVKTKHPLLLRRLVSIRKQNYSL